MALNLKMNLDKKSLIQIVVLVVLIAVGAGAYFMQQGGGGLDFDFITGFLESKPATTRAPAAKVQAPAADVKARADAPAIPAAPAESTAIFMARKRARLVSAPMTWSSPSASR